VSTPTLFVRSRATDNKSNTSNPIEIKFSEYFKGQMIPLEKDLRLLMQEAIKTERDQGDFVPENLTKLLCKVYSSLDLMNKKNFFSIMSRELGTDNNGLLKAANALIASKDREESTVVASENNLRHAITPLYEKVFMNINSQLDGMKFLVDMRKDLLDIVNVSKEAKSDAKLKGLSENLKNLLGQWFAIGFLQLERITWNQPAAILERIINYSSVVHPIGSWMDLKARLGQGRRCFAFFHPSMPGEPLVFIEVGLTHEISTKIEPLLKASTIDEESATTAIFYAINSTQPGLSGIDLGHLLIKRVVFELQKELPNLKVFSTLSPIPGFASWLESKLAFEIQPENKFSEKSALLTETEVKSLQKLDKTTSSPVQILADTLKSNWQNDAEKESVLQPILMRLCARYLAVEKKRSLAIDPVANFHLRNGAQLYQINWLADLSTKRMKQSYGLMVNYKYNLDELRQNNEDYLLRNTINTSSAVKSLLQ
jgi:hypothetical protein